MRDVNALKRQPRQALDGQTTTGDVSPNLAPSGDINPLTPQPLDPSRNVTTQPSQRTAGTPKKKPHPLLSPPVLVTTGLLVVLFEVALWAAVGLLWWAAINLLLVLVLIGTLRLALAWWRRQFAPPAPGRAAGGGRAASGPAGTGGRSPLGRLFGRGRSGSGRTGGLLGARSGGTSGSGSGRKGGLGRLLSGGRRSGPGAAGRSGSGRAGSGLRGLLGGRRSGGSASRTAGSGAGARTGSARRGGLAGALGRMRSGGGRGLLGRDRAGGSTPSGRPAARAGRQSSGGRSLRSLLAGGPRRGAGKSQSSGLAGFAKGVRQGADAVKRKPSPGPTAAKKPQPTPSQRRPEGGTDVRGVGPEKVTLGSRWPICSFCKQRKEPGCLRDVGIGAACPACISNGKVADDAAKLKASPQPRAATTPKENSTMVQHSDDASLQRWGRNLRTVSPAIEELARSADSQTQLAGAIAASVQKLATQGETDLPAHPTVTSEASAIAAELKQAQAESEAAVAKLRGLAARADALGATYLRQHETDEGRLAGERGSRAREKRADVAHAEQDT